MPRRIVCLFACALAIWAFPRGASAGVVTCPNPLLSGQTNTYTVTSANVQDCVWGDGNIGQGGGNDDFLSGLGTNDTAYGNSGPTFGINDWVEIGSNGNPGGSITGVTFTNLTNQSADFLITATGYTAYGLGVKDGSSPDWSVFLLSASPSPITGNLSMTGGSFSHFVLYGTRTPIQQTNDNLETAPEPASLLLLGSGLIVAGRQLRARRRNRAHA